jgi:hypothetical protein
MRRVLAALAFLFVSSLAAQPLTVGVHVPIPNGTATLTSTLAPVTYVNLADYATADGTVNKASVYWSGSCSGAFKLVFLRNQFSSHSSFTVVATRGPFDASSGRNDVTLSPPVSLVNGDVIGVVQMHPSNTCGTVTVLDYGSNDGFTLITVSDLSVSGSLGASSNFSPGYRISAVAYASDPVLVRILPAAGAAQGATAFFRTAVQIYNSSLTPITGNFVFHPQGASAAPADPTLAINIPPHSERSYPDIVTQMGTSGLGSIDVVTNGGAQPIVTARIFSDAGAVGGTSGFSEEGVRPADALNAFRPGLLITPDDPAHFRMNIGIRTLDSGATVTMGVFDGNGSFLGSKTTTLPANYFLQDSFAGFTSVANLPAAGLVRISIEYPGSAFIYSSTIDNRTSDSTFRMADAR